MGKYSSLHWLLLLVIFVIPAWRVVAKAGFNGAWSLLLLIPFVNLIAIWVFAFMRWPVAHPRT